VDIPVQVTEAVLIADGECRAKLLSLFPPKPQ
jgi:hypothetical protein